ncbi:MAG TPA: NHL repeat-containing protein [candidate division Zixibacteria bacterium]|nr:NHL repeat-containing protein [candidate division Zixibacteria bacterium]
MTFLDSQTRRSSLVALCALALGACANPQNGRVDEGRSPATRVPVALAFKQEIGGEIFGRRLSRPITPRRNYRGDVIFIDQGNQRLVQLDSLLRPIAVRGGVGSQQGQFQRPVSLALDDSYVYVADLDLDHIQRFDHNLNPVDRFEFQDPIDALRLGRPGGLVVTADRSLWVSDIDRERITIFTAFLADTLFAADYSSGGLRLDEPGAMTSFGSRFVAVCDSKRGRIAILDLNGAEHGVIAEGELRTPSDIAAVGDLFWVTDSGRGEVLCLAGDGTALYRSGQQSAGDEFRLREPAGVCLLNDRALVVADTGHDRLLVYEILFLDGN